MRNCVDLVKDVMREAENQGLADRIQIFGGIAAKALEDSRTIIDYEERRIIAPEGFVVPQYREEDETLRDADLFIESTDPLLVGDIQTMAERAIDNALEISTFGIIPKQSLQRQFENPIVNALWRGTADRYGIEREGQIVEAYKALFPFAVEIDLSTFEPWLLFIGRNDRHPVPVCHPGTAILNYLTRALYGVRWRDRKEKFPKLSDHTLTTVPQVRDWLLDGPGRTQISLARVLDRIGQDPRNIQPLKIGNTLTVPAYTGPLEEHPAFMIPNQTDVVKAVVLALTQVKARADSFAESQEDVVRFWRGHVQQRFAGKLIQNQ